MGLWKKTAAVVATAALVFGLVGTAFAAGPDEVSAAADRMHTLNIIQGDATGNLNLGNEITRAELMTILVRAFGQEDNASILKGAAAFPDTASHWASGYIQIAKNIIVEKNHYEMGMPDGNFAPDGKVTNAQAVAFLMKFIGVAPDSSKSWPANYLDAAVSAGLVSAADAATLAPIANDNATRGLVFYLADSSFSSYPLASGKTVYASYVKPQAPVITAKASEDITTASKVTITGTVSADAKNVYVGTTATPITVGANGAFSFDYDLSMGPNAITIGATDIVGQTATFPLTVTRTVGNATEIAVASDSLTVAAGATVDLAASVKDAQGNVIAGAAIEAADADNGTYAAGSYTAPTKAGSYTLTLKSGDLTKSVSVTVNPAALAAITVTGANSSFAVGAQQQLTATGADQYGNAVELTGASWTATGGVANNNGQFVAYTSGNVTVTVTANGVSGTFTGVAFGKATKVNLSAISELVANGVSTTTVTATAVDANGATDTTYTGTATFQSTNTGVAAIDSDTKSVSFVNGVAVATIDAGSTVGSATINAVVSGMTTASATVKTVKQVLTSITASVDPATLAADASVSSGLVKIKLLDQDGVRLLAGNIPASMAFSAKSDNTSVADIQGTPSTNTYSSTYPYHYQATVTSKGTVGTANFTITVTGPTAYKDMAVPTVAVSTLTVGQAYKLGVDPVADLTVGKTASVKVRVYDYNGNQNTGLTDGDAVVTLTNTAKTSQTWTATGITAGAITISIPSTTAKTYNFEASATGVNNSVNTPITLQKATGSVTFVPGDAAALSLDASPKILNANGVATSTLTAKVVDAYGNAVTDGTYALKFHKTAGSTTATQDFADITVNTVAGVATATITASVKNNGSDSYTVSDTAATGALVSKSVTVTSKIMGAPAQLDVSTDSTLTATAGKDAEVIVDVEDALGTLVSSDNSTNVTLTVKDSDGNVVNTLNATAAAGQATFDFTQTAIDTYSFKATATGLTSKSGSVTFNAGTAVALKVSPSLSTLGTSSATGVKVYALDANGNKTTVNSSVTLTFASSNTDLGTVSAATYTVASIPSTGVTPTGWTFTAKSVPGTATLTIGDNAGNLTSGTADINIVAVGDPTHFTVSVSGTPVVGSADTDNASVITVDVVDASGTRVTTTNSVYAELTVTGQSANGNVSFWKTTAGTTGASVTGTSPNTLKFYTDAFTNGEVKFYVTDTKAETLNFSVKLGTNYTTFSAATGSATFASAKADRIAFGTPDKVNIAGNGQDITVIPVSAQDSSSNVDTSINGTVYFSLVKGNDYATLLNTSASFVDGVATVSLQSKVATDNGLITIGIYTDATDKDGNVLKQATNLGTLADSDHVYEKADIVKVDGKAVTFDTDGVYVGGVTTGTITTNNPSVAFDTLASDPTTSGVTGSGIDTVTYQYKATNNNVWTDVYEDAAGDLTTFNFTDFGATALADGSYDFRAIAVDNAGNSSTSKVNTVTIDTTPATVSSIVYSQTDNKLTITFSEAMKSSSLTNVSTQVYSGASADATDLGTGASGTWNTDKTVLTITLGAGATIDSTTEFHFSGLQDAPGNTMDVTAIYKIQ